MMFSPSLANLDGKQQMRCFIIGADSQNPDAANTLRTRTAICVSFHIADIEEIFGLMMIGTIGMIGMTDAASKRP